MWVFLLCLTTLLVKLGHWIYTQTNTKPNIGKLPPGSMGFPIIGETIFCWPQRFHILPNICEDFIFPSQIRFFVRVFWVRQKFMVANRLFFCNDLPTIEGYWSKIHKKKQRKSIALASISNFPFHFCLHAEVAYVARVRDSGLWGYK